LKPVLDQKGGDLTSEERNLFSVAFKNLISSKRSALRTIAAIEQNPKYSKFGERLVAYKKKIEESHYKDCEGIIEIIKSKVLAKPCQDEAKAFFLKMVADYYRYIAETAQGDKLEQVKKEALKAYVDANAINLHACNSIKLGLALNFSVFYYEVMKDNKKAISLADESL